MAYPLELPVVCPVFVGRGRALAALGDALSALTAGQGGTVLITGEAGVGKSRLLAEARRLAGSAGVTVLQGNCFEHDRALPYAPLLDCLRGRLAGASAAAIQRVAGPFAPELVSLLPELGDALATSSSSRQSASDPHQRLLRAVEYAVDRLADGRPAVLVVEDLHWADAASLDCLARLARRAPQQPYLLLLTYRPDEAAPELQHLLTELDRSRLAGELRLNRLGLTDVHAMLRAMIDPRRPVRADLLNVVFTLTEGNPFFVEEILRSGEVLAAQDGEDQASLARVAVPRTVQAAVQRRSERLSKDDRETLQLAAVVGQRFAFTLLQELTGLPEQTLLLQMKHFIAAGLVEERSSEEFAFRHALTREAVYSELLARERQALHGRIASVLDQRGAGVLQPGDLAYHYFEAGDWLRAREHATAAGVRARELYAPAAAVEQFTRALRASEWMGVPGSASLRRARGLAYESLGDFDAALSDYQAALAHARAIGDRAAEWQVLLDLGMLWAERDYTRTGELVREALHLARELASPALIAHSLNRLGNWHMNLDEPHTALQLHKEALTAFEVLDDPDGIAATLDLLGISSVIAGEFSTGTAYLERALEYFRARHDLIGEASSLALMALCGAPHLVNTMAAAITLAGAVELAEAALAAAGASGQRSAEAFAHIKLSICIGAGGEFGEALAHADQAATIAEQIGHRQWLLYALLSAGTVLVDMGAYRQALPKLERAASLAEELGSLHWIRHAAGWLAWTCALSGDHERAHDLIERARTRLEELRSSGQRAVWYGAAESALRSGDPARTLAIAARLEATAVGGSAPIPQLRILRGEALLALGRAAEAVEILEEGARGAEWQGARPLVWRCRVALARTLRALGRDAAAAEQRLAAVALADAMAATIPAGALRNQYVRYAEAALPAAGSRSDKASGSRRLDELTAREREVAALVAQGLSNRAIAEALVVTERTVEAHVGHALAKLGFSSRTQLAAWVAGTLPAGARSRP